MTTMNAGAFDPQIGGGLTMPGQAPPPPPGAPPPVAAGPPAPINTAGLSLGGGMSLPTQANPYVAPAPPPAPAPALPKSIAKDLEANAKSSREIQNYVDDTHKSGIIADLQRMGAAPAAPPSTATTTPPGGVPNTAAKAAGGASAAPAGPTDYFKLGAAPSGRVGPEYEASERLSNDAQEKQLREGNALANMQAAQASALADAHIVAEQHRQAGAAQAAEHLAEVQRKREEEDASIRQAQDDLAKDKIDPDHIYGDHKTVGKLLAGIGMAMGAYGASLGHHANFAQDYIKNAVDADVDAQKANHAAKAARVQGMVNNYDRHRQAGLDDASAAAAAREDAYQAALRMGDAQAEKSGSPILQQRWAVARSGLEADAAKAAEERDRAQNQAGYQRLQALQKAAAPTSVDEQVAKADLENQDEMAAAKRLSGAPEGELAGFGVGGRLRHWASDTTGLDLESSEAKANRRDVETLSSHALKRDGGRVNSEELNRFGKNVRSEEDVRGLTADEIRRAKLEHDQAKRGVLGKGGGKTARSEPDE